MKESARKRDAETRLRTRNVRAEDSKLVNPMFGLLGLISSVPTLTTEEIDDLVKVFKNPRTTESEREKAREKLIITNARLVINIAKQYSRAGFPLMDLISEGTIGLMIAIEKFDPKKGYRLSTYATWWIKQRILRYMINNQYLIRIPEHVIEKINRMQRATEAFIQKHTRKPDFDEVAEIAGLSKLEAKRYRGSIPDVFSLEDGRGRDGEEDTVSFQERIGTGEEIFSALLDRLTVKQMFQLLDEKERAVISRRYGITLSPEGELITEGETKTLDQISAELNMSREGVRQTEKSALRKLRKTFYSRD